MKQANFKQKQSSRVVFSILLSLTLLFLTQSVQAQVTIGSDTEPNKDALLDLKQNNSGSSSKGLLLPRVSLSSTISFSPLSAHVAGMAVYNTATTTTGANDVTPGYYYNDGSKWVKLFIDGIAAPPLFFYMPSIVLPTDDSDPSYNSSTGIFTVNLYNHYAEQFGLSHPASAKNPSATTLPVLSNSALEYFITYYDNTVFTNVLLTNAGVLTYKLNSPITISEKTFMNIVFKVK